MILWSVLISAAFAKVCTPAKITVAPPEPDGGGKYMRVHPSGDYVLQSHFAGADILDLTSHDANGKPIAKLIQTAAANESYPVEGSWDLVASPLHKDGMRYYRFQDLLQLGTNAEPVFADKEHDNFYHSAVELERPT